MIIECSDLTFRELEETDIEAVRVWRNSDFVRRNMQEQSLIAPEAQTKWFQSVKNGCHWYFLVAQDEQPFGVANLKDINCEERTAEAGLFMIREQFADGVHTMACSAVLIHLAFDYLNLKVLHSTTLSSSLPAIRFNQSLGFTPISEDHRVIRWCLNEQTGRQSRDRILRLLSTYNKMEKPMDIVLYGQPKWSVNPCP